jgi:hypothetical protein
MAKEAASAWWRSLKGADDGAETVLQHGGAELGTMFLQKPFAVDDLIAKMRQLLAEGTARRR